MRIRLFTCNAENNRVDKTDYIYNEFVMEGTLKERTSIIQPTIIVEKTNPMEYRYNYMYIDEFKRYYYIDDFVSIRNMLWEIHAHVDVLYTYKASILASKCIIDKSQDYSTSNMYLNDGSFVMDSRKYTTVIPFPEPLPDEGEFILITAGGYTVS